MSKINRRYLKVLIRESLEQMRSQQAIDHAGKTVRKDGVPYEQWIDEVLEAIEQGSTLPAPDPEDLPADMYDLYLQNWDPGQAAADYMQGGY